MKHQNPYNLRALDSSICFQVQHKGTMEESCNLFDRNPIQNHVTKIRYIFCGYFSGCREIQFYVKVLYATRLSSGVFRFHWVVSERNNPLRDRAKTFSLSGAVFMKFSNNVLPFSVLPIEAQSIFRNVLSSLFLGLLEIGEHTFTARLCHGGQVLKERVCETLELQRN